MLCKLGCHMARNIPSVLVKPGRIIYYLSIVTDDDPEIIERIFDLLKSRNIDFSEGLLNYGEGYRRISLFIDISGSNATIKEITELIKKIVGVREIFYSEPLENHIAFADIEFPLTSINGEERVFLILENWLSHIFLHVHKRFGTVGLVFLYESGRGIGLELGKEYRKIFSSFDNAFNALLRLLKSLGFINPIDFITLGNNVVVSFRGDLEAKVFCDQVNKNELCDNFVRGILEGFMEGFFEIRYKTSQLTYYKDRDLLRTVLERIQYL